MERTEEFWNKLYSVFDPQSPLTGDQGDRLYCSPEHDPYDLMKVLFRKSHGSARPPKAFLAGHRGSGKTSLLLRLLRHCHQDFMPVYVDIEHNLDKDKANRLDILYLIGLAIYQAAEQEGMTPNIKYREGLLDAVSSIMTTRKNRKDDRSTDFTEIGREAIVLTSSMLGDPAKKLAEAISKPLSITAGVSDEEIREHKAEPQVQGVVNAINLIIADVQHKAGRPVIVIVDGLDKLPDLEQSKQIFLDSRSLLGPICHMIYTVPMSIYASPRFGQVDEDAASFLLPNIKIFDKNHTEDPHAAGYAIMRDVIAKRIDYCGLKGAEVIDPETADYLIRYSGGVIRWLITLVRDACMISESLGHDRIVGNAARQAVSNLTSKLTLRLTVEGVDELRKVRLNHRPSETAVSNALLHGLYIVAYRNDMTWYDVHPLMWGELEEDA